MIQNKLADALRRKRGEEINTDPGEKEALEKKYGKVWTTSELQEEFDVVGFAAPLVVVNRKSDGVVGSLEFQGSPRYYFNFQEDK